MTLRIVPLSHGDTGMVQFCCRMSFSGGLYRPFRIMP